jgi:hypothetical protein
MNNLVDAAVTQGREWNAMSTRHKRRLQSVESMRKKVQSSLYDQLLKMRQWQVLRSLRVEFNLRHRIFRRIATDSPGLQLLLKSCPRPAELLDLATLTFKDILRGDTPSSLKEIFGFINLAVSMAAVMEARGIQSSFDPKKTEFDTRRQRLPDEADRLVFDELVFRMWPEKYRHDVSFAPLSGQAQAFLNLSTGWPAFQSLPWVPNQEPLLPGLSKAPASMHHIAANILDDARDYDEFDFKDFLNWNISMKPVKNLVLTKRRFIRWRQVQQSPKCPIPQLNLRMIRPPRKNPIRKKA